MYTVHALSGLVEHHHILAYGLIFLVTIVEGEVMAIAAGILVLLGALNFWVCLIAILCGGFLKTIFGYSIGKFLHKRFDGNRFLTYIEKKVLTVMPHFEEKPFWSIFASKFLMVNHVVIVFSGYKRINFKKFLKAELSSTLIWALSLLALGYFFSYAAIRVSRQISDFLLIVVLFTVGFFLLDKLISLIYNVFESIFHNHGNEN